MGVDFLSKHKLVSDQVTRAELAVILNELQKLLSNRAAGDVVEFGCYLGTTSLFMQRLLLGTGKVLHVYDSFEGLPPKTMVDQSPLGGQYKPGELKATKAAFIKNFKQAGLPLPIIHKGWFDRLTAKDLPRSVCFAYLDGDFYDSIRQSLGLVWPRLSKGAVVVVDDYSHQGLPGAKKAVDDWLKTYKCQLRVRESLAIIAPVSP